jgi:hypothetical protein
LAVTDETVFIAEAKAEVEERVDRRAPSMIDFKRRGEQSIVDILACFICIIIGFKSISKTLRNLVRFSKLRTIFLQNFGEANILG